MKYTRLSSYIIPVELQDGKFMLIHGYTGAIDIVTRDLYEKISSASQKIDLSDEMIEILQKRGYITKKSRQEEINHVKKIANIFSKRDDLYPKSFTLLVTYNCNFKCPYCYEQESIINSPSFVISEKMIDNFFEAIPKVEPNEELWKKTINLFGGEPLLKDNKNRVKYIIRKGQERGFKFSATSNGYDLEHYEEFLSCDAIGMIQVTIDGSKQVHDNRRLHITESSTFDKIVDNIEMALKKGVTVAVRINTDNTNVGDVVNLDKYFQNKKFYSYDNFIVYAAYLGGEVNFNPEMYNDEITLSNTYDDFFEIFKNKELKIKHNYTLYKRLYSAIKNKTSIPLSSRHCNSHYSNFIFDPLGNIYTCLELVGKKEQSIGIYNGADIKWNEKAILWKQRNISNINGCNKCRYALLCGGGCFAKVLQDSKCKSSFCGDFLTILRKVCNEVYFDLMNPYV